MYDVIKFFGTPKQLLNYTRTFRVAEALQKAYHKNVKQKPKPALVKQCEVAGCEV